MHRQLNTLCRRRRESPQSLNVRNASFLGFAEREVAQQSGHGGLVLRGGGLVKRVMNHASRKVRGGKGGCFVLTKIRRWQKSSGIQQCVMVVILAVVATILVALPAVTASADASSDSDPLEIAQAQAAASGQPV